MFLGMAQKSGLSCLFSFTFLFFVRSPNNGFIEIGLSTDYRQIRVIQKTKKKAIAFTKSKGTAPGRFTP